QELDRARAQFRASLMMSRESPSSRAAQAARQLLLYGRPIGTAELMERLSSLTVDRLTALSGRLCASKPTVTAIGPVGKLMPISAIRENLSWRQPQSVAV